MNFVLSWSPDVSSSTFLPQTPSQCSSPISPSLPEESQLLGAQVGSGACCGWGRWSADRHAQRSLVPHPDS